MPCRSCSVNQCVDRRTVVRGREEATPAAVNRMSPLVTKRLIEISDRQTIWRPPVGAPYGRRNHSIAGGFFSDKLTEEIRRRVSIDQIDHAFLITRGR